MRWIYIRILPFLVAVLIAASMGLAPAQQKPEVDLALVLAVDVSGSINKERFTLQQEGYAQAFLNTDVLKAITSGLAGKVAVTLMFWSSPIIQSQVVPWRVLSGRGSAEGFSSEVMATTRGFGGSTSISGAIYFGVHLLHPRFDQPFLMPGRRIIDISGDEANNDGDPPRRYRNEAVRQGIVINGLPILGFEQGVLEHYRDHVIGGPGSFVLPAASYKVFPEAIRRKLILEIAFK